MRRPEPYIPAWTMHWGRSGAPILARGFKEKREGDTTALPFLFELWILRLASVDLQFEMTHAFSPRSYPASLYPCFENGGIGAVWSACRHRSTGMGRCACGHERARKGSRVGRCCRICSRVRRCGSLSDCWRRSAGIRWCSGEGRCPCKRWRACGRAILAAMRSSG